MGHFLLDNHVPSLFMHVLCICGTYVRSTRHLDGINLQLCPFRCLGDRISHVAYSKASGVLFVSTVSGSLALFNGAEEDHALINVYSKLLTTSSTLQPFALSDECSRLAVIGPHPTTVTVFDLEDMQEVGVVVGVSLSVLVLLCCFC